MEIKKKKIYRDNQFKAIDEWEVCCSKMLLCEWVDDGKFKPRCWLDSRQQSGHPIKQPFCQRQHWYWLILQKPWIMFSDNYSRVKVSKRLWLWQIKCGYGMVRIRQLKCLVIGKKNAGRTWTPVSDSKVGWESSTTPTSTVSPKKFQSYMNNLKWQMRYYSNIIPAVFHVIPSWWRNAEMWTNVEVADWQ